MAYEGIGTPGGLEREKESVRNIAGAAQSGSFMVFFALVIFFLDFLGGLRYNGFEWGVWTAGNLTARLSSTKSL